MERLLKIASDPGFSKPLRVNAMRSAFDSQAGQALLNSAGGQLSPNWIEESIDLMDTERNKSLKSEEAKTRLTEAQAKWYEAGRPGVGGTKGQKPLTVTEITNALNSGLITQEQAEAEMAKRGFSLPESASSAYSPIQPGSLPGKTLPPKAGEPWRKAPMQTSGFGAPGIETPSVTVRPSSTQAAAPQVQATGRPNTPISAAAPPGMESVWGTLDEEGRQAARDLLNQGVSPQQLIEHLRKKGTQ